MMKGTCIALKCELFSEPDKLAEEDSGRQQYE